LVTWVLERRPDLLDLAIAAQPTLASISFGDPKPYVERLHAAGILVASQVQSLHWSQVALDAASTIGRRDRGDRPRRSDHSRSRSRGD
jgi:nitronate monooxygenase